MKFKDNEYIATFIISNNYSILKFVVIFGILSSNTFLYLHLFYLHKYFACMNVCAMCMPCTLRGEKRALDILKLEL